MTTDQSRLENLSVILIAGTEEENIGDCLRSVVFAGEMIVVYSDATDRTSEIARGFTEQVVFRPFDSFSAQKRFALGLATCEWVLSIDADERVTPELESEIRDVLRLSPVENSYSMPRKNFYRNKWLQHGRWYPDRQVRLFRRAAASVNEKLIHEGFLVDGKRGELSSPLLHYTLPGIGHLLQKNVHYARYEALEKASRRRVTILDFTVRPILAFLQRYVMAGGFLDGREGLIVAMVHAINKAQVQMYLWEMQHPSAPSRE